MKENLIFEKKKMTYIAKIKIVLLPELKNSSLTVLNSFLSFLLKSKLWNMFPKLKLVPQIKNAAPNIVLSKHIKLMLIFFKWTLPIAIFSVLIAVKKKKNVSHIIKVIEKESSWFAILSKSKKK